MMKISIHTWLQSCSLPRLEARLLLQHVLKISHAQMITQSAYIIDDNTLSLLRTLVNRRKQGEPIAYLIGYKEFFSRDFYVSPAVLIPRPETEHLIEISIQNIPPNATVWELGTGSGIIAVTLKLLRDDLTIWASDLSTEALVIAKKNANKHHAKIHFSQGSWFDCQTRPEFSSCQLILSNPPYIDVHDQHLKQGDLLFEPQMALTDFNDGLSAIRKIIAEAKYFLSSGGYLYLEHGYNQADAIRQIFAEHQYSQIQTFQDLAGLDRISSAQFFK